MTNQSSASLRMLFLCRSLVSPYQCHYIRFNRSLQLLFQNLEPCPADCPWTVTRTVLRTNKNTPIPATKAEMGVLIYTVIQFSEPARGRQPLHDGRNGRRSRPVYAVVEPAVSELAVSAATTSVPLTADRAVFWFLTSASILLVKYSLRSP